MISKEKPTNKNNTIIKLPFTPIKEPYWYYECEVELNTNVYNTELKYICENYVCFILNHKIVKNDYENNLRIVKEKYVDNEIDWEKIKTYIEKNVSSQKF